MHKIIHATQVITTTATDKMPTYGDNDINAFTCPICHEFYRDASFIARCGHEFCHSCISSWLHTKNTCPTCRGPAFPEELKPCYFFRSILRKIELDQRNDSASQSLSLSDRERDRGVRLLATLKFLQKEGDEDEAS